MNPSKFLIGGVATVGSVATVAVAANQFGVTTSSSETPEIAPTKVITPDNSNKEPVTKAPEVPPRQQIQRNFSGIAASTTREAANKALLNNWQSIDDRKIKIQKGNSIKALEDFPIEEDNYLEGLIGHLNSNDNWIESIDKKIPFIFQKSGDDWKILSKEQLDEWIKNTSLKDESIRQIEGLNKYLSLEELNKLLNYLKGKEDLFKKTQENKRTILFEKVGSDWKHSKTEIESWLSNQNEGNNKFTIKIQISGGDQDLEQVDESNLVNLLSYLKSNKNTLFKLIKDKKPTSLTFKAGWEVVHSEETINNWVSNTSSGNATLKLWKDYSEQQLPELKTKDGEFKKLFGALRGKESLFSGSTKGKIIVFEEDNGSWKHIKEAIKEWIKPVWDEDKIDKIKIKGDGETSIENTDDDKLTGLLKHLKDKQEEGDEISAGRTLEDSEDDDDVEEEDDYESILDKNDLVLKKKDGESNHWERVKP